MAVPTNIKLRKPNCTVENGYFFYFDDDMDALLQKTDDGTTAFMFPLDTLLTTTVKTTDYDGTYFWSMESATDNIYIKQWKIDNYICKLQNEIHIQSQAGVNTFSSQCFALEHYRTVTTTTISGGVDTSVDIEKYYNTPEIIFNAGLSKTIHIGPNENGEEEDLEVTGTYFGGIDVTGTGAGSTIKYSYPVGTQISFHRRIWIFNDYDGEDSTTGALYSFDSTTGDILDKFPGGAYKDIDACTYAFTTALSAQGYDTLMYVKGANTLFVDTSIDAKDLQDASNASDDFTGTNGAFPPKTISRPSEGDTIPLWETVAGTPTIQSNKLYLDTTTATSPESIKGSYLLEGDFSVSIRGSLGTYNTTYSGSGSYFSHAAALYFPKEVGRFCKIQRGYSTEIGGALYHSYSTIARTATDTVISGVAVQPNEDEYIFTMSRTDATVNFSLQTVVSGITQPAVSLGATDMYYSECELHLEAATTIAADTLTTYFDYVTYSTGTVSTSASLTKLPYYGSMVMDNIEADEYTIDPLTDMGVEGDNLYRFHQDGSLTNYGLSPLSPFVTSISLAANPAIIAANNASTSDITAFVRDQFLQPIANRQVVFQENGDGVFTSSATKTTGVDGKATITYQAGVNAQTVIITATAEQSS